VINRVNDCAWPVVWKKDRESTTRVSERSEASSGVPGTVQKGHVLPQLFPGSHWLTKPKRCPLAVQQRRIQYELTVCQFCYQEWPITIHPINVKDQFGWLNDTEGWHDRTLQHDSSHGDGELGKQANQMKSLVLCQFCLPWCIRHPPAAMLASFESSWAANVSFIVSANCCWDQRDMRNKANFSNCKVGTYSRVLDRLCDRNDQRQVIALCCRTHLIDKHVSSATQLGFPGFWKDKPALEDDIWSDQEIK